MLINYRRFDELGRIVIPKIIRKLFNLSEGDMMKITVECERIILEKFEVE
jgi:AbrB family looped-hinge helix DNA binding protein